MGPCLRDVVVGADGSNESIVALRWACNKIVEGGQLHAVHVVAPVEELAVDAALGDSVKLQHLRERDLRDVWIPQALGDQPVAIDVTPTLREGAVADELMKVADEVDAEAIVVGHHARARHAPQLVGHVTATLLRESERPIIIVPREWAPDETIAQPVAVGVGVAGGTQAALRWAMSHQLLEHVGLLLVHAHGPRTLFRTGGWLDVLAYHLDPAVLPGWVEQDLLDLADDLRDRTGTHVDVAVSVRPGRIGARLVEAGMTASMLVIGRGEPPFIRNHAIAPYLRHAIVHAPCPIVVVPAVRDR
jgi:nucleotide-binding universal stress UspA family protein